VENEHKTISVFFFKYFAVQYPRGGCTPKHFKQD
jgi:hypothetical protein